MPTPTNRTDEVRELARQLMRIGLIENDVTVIDKVTEAIASAITSAVEAERERCAKVAEDLKKMSDAWDSLIGIVVKTHHHDSVFDASCSICNDINTACRNVEICRQTIRQTPTKEGV